MSRRSAPKAYEPSGGPEGIPLGEDHQADRDPALPARRQLAEPAGRDCQADGCARQAGQHAADEHVDVAHGDTR